MAIGYENHSPPECYFCESNGQLYHSRMSRRIIKTSDGKRIVDTVCRECDPKY